MLLLSEQCLPSGCCSPLGCTAAAGQEGARDCLEMRTLLENSPSQDASERAAADSPVPLKSKISWRDVSACWQHMEIGEFSLECL
jgi:hypothetical protein